MILYLAVVLFPLLVGGIYQQNMAKVTANQEENIKGRNKQRFIWLLIAALPMFLLIAFRGWRMGPDTGVYQEMFLRLADTPWGQLDRNTEMEYGFLVFNKLVSYITKSALGFQIIYTTVYLFSVINFINQFEEGNFLSLYLFGTLNLYTFMFTGVRQCLAMCICLWSYKFIKQRKIIPVILIILLASTFHKSAVIFILAYFIYANKINVLNIILYIACGVIAFLNIDFIQEWFNDNLGYDYQVEETGNGFIFFAVMVVITVFSLILAQKNKTRAKNLLGLININFITLICWILRLETRVAERPSYYFMFFTIAMLSSVVYLEEDPREKMQYKLYIFIATFILFVYRLSTSLSVYVPYQVFR